MIWWQQAAMGKPWTPWTDGNILLRLDADPGGIVKNGATASHWIDLSGIDSDNKHVNNATALQQPAWSDADADFNGHGSLAFGAASRLYSGTWATPCPTVVTDYYVVKFSNGPFAAAAILLSGLDVATHILYGAGTGIVGIKDTANLQFTVGTGMYNRVCVICAVYNGASSALYINSKTATISGNAGTATAHSTMIVGAYDASGIYPWLGKGSTILRFAGVDAAATRNRKLDYFAAKYGVTLT